MVSLPTLVRQQKSGQTHRREIGTRIFNIFSNTLGTAGIQFGTADNTKYKLVNFTTMLTEMSRSRITAESVAADFETNKDAPGGKWIRNMINGMSSDQTEHVCNEMILHTARLGNKNNNSQNRHTDCNGQTSHTKIRQGQFGLYGIHHARALPSLRLVLPCR